MTKEKIQLVRGMRDLIFDEAEKIVKIINIAREISNSYGYREVIPPTIEYYNLFAEKSGYEIQKRMYAFEDLSGRKVALRPEGTPSIARIFINELQALPKPVRLSYFINVFRYDEPQKARYREFWQAGFEHLGSSSILADIEIIKLCYDIFERLNLKDVKIKLGNMDLIKRLLMKSSIEEKDLPYYLHLIDKKNFEEIKNNLKTSNKGKDLYEILLQLSQLKGNIEEKFSEASKILSKHEDLINLLNSFKDEVIIISSLFNVELDFSFARGIEYYTGIIYEYYHEGLEVAIGGGGRYDMLIEYYGGPRTPATGCALGIDRIALIFKNEEQIKQKKCLVYLTEVNKETMNYALSFLNEIRKFKLIVNFDTSNRNLSESLKYALKEKYDFFIIIGLKEIKNQTITIRNLHKKEQNEISLNNLAEWFSKNV
jgi:histidyl-tRNA synthetase